MIYLKLHLMMLNIRSMNILLLNICCMLLYGMKRGDR